MSLTKSSLNLNKKFIRQIVNSALKEDKARSDITTLTFVPAGESAEAKIIAKAKGVIAGIDIAREVFKSVESRLQVKVLKWTGSKASHLNTESKPNFLDGSPWRN